MTRADLRAVWLRTLRRISDRHDYSVRRRPALVTFNDFASAHSTEVADV